MKPCASPWGNCYLTSPDVQPELVTDTCMPYFIDSLTLRSCLNNRSTFLGENIYSWRKPTKRPRCRGRLSFPVRAGTCREMSSDKLFSIKIVEHIWHNASHQQAHGSEVLTDALQYYTQVIVSYCVLQHPHWMSSSENISTKPPGTANHPHTRSLCMSVCLSLNHNTQQTNTLFFCLSLCLFVSLSHHSLCLTNTLRLKQRQRHKLYVCPSVSVSLSLLRSLFLSVCLSCTY